ncbi:MAG: Rieske 2Fe-2S domain-containing protein [Chloroflexi bacterium]|nr:Rieske 2Fe-2S domain-containing protein [Chloroflexota bacterium]
MLSREDNELLCRVGPGTPTGTLLRHYWLPFLFDWEIEADAEPQRVRLLGEDLIAFRDSLGRVGLLDDHCAHRGASLFFGRNEECGLRCVYHGWKYDVDGRCVDMPNEPPESTFKDKIRHTAYPCLERGGVVWAYLGPQTPPPPLPHFEWMDLLPEQRYGSKRVQYSNWVQAMEGDIDQSHVSFVHSRLNLDDETELRFRTGGPRRLVDQIRKNDTHPHFEVVETDYGVCIGAGREAGDGARYWRITQHLMPFHTMTGPYGENPTRGWRAWVPVDDEQVFVLGITFHPTRPLADDEVDRQANRSGVWNISPEMRMPVSSQPYGRWRPRPSLENDFFQDRQVQRTKTYSGISEFWAQDAAPQLSMGAITDRTREHLGTSDLAIITVRRRLLAAAKQMQEHGTAPPETERPDCYLIRSDALLLPAAQSWFAASEERRKVMAGVNPSCPA